MKTNIPYYAFSDVLTIVNGRNQRKVEDKKGLFPIYGSGGIMGWANDYICPENTVVIGRKGSINNPIFVEKKFWNVDTAFGLVAKQTILLPKYLYYFCVNFNFESLNTTVTIPSLTKANLLKVQIPIPSISEQEKIVLLLDKIGSLICIRKQHLDKLNQLASSRFIEMFGDQTDFDRWKTCTVADVAEVCVGVVIRPTQYYADFGIPAFRSLNIGPMKINDSDWVYFTAEGHAKNQKSIVHEGDVLVVRSGAPGTACVATHDVDGYNAVDIIIARPNHDRINSNFLAMFTNMPHGMQFIRSKTGGAAQQHFNIGGYKALKLILPPLVLQNEFAAFVEELDKSKVAGESQRILLEKIAGGGILQWGFLDHE